MMNKKGLGWLVWLILIVVVMAIGIFFLAVGDESSDVVDDTGEEGEGESEVLSDSEFEDIESSDEILNEIDDSLDYLG